MPSPPYRKMSVTSRPSGTAVSITMIGTALWSRTFPAVDEAWPLLKASSARSVRGESRSLEQGLAHFSGKGARPEAT